MGTIGMPNPNAVQSISLWVKLVNLTGQQNFIVMTDKVSGAIQFGIKDGVVKVWGWGAVDVVAGTAPTTGAWHHIAYTYDGTNNTIYIDGVNKGTSTTAHQTGSIGKVYLGTWTPNYDILNGSLDDVRVYNRALSSTEITTLAGKSNLTSPAGGTHTFSDAFQTSGDFTIGTGTVTGAGTVTVGGSFVNSGGTFTDTGTVTLTGTTSGLSLVANGATLNALTVNGVGGTYNFGGTVAVTQQLHHHQRHRHRIGRHLRRWQLVQFRDLPGDRGGDPHRNRVQDHKVERRSLHLAHHQRWRDLHDAGSVFGLGRHGDVDQQHAGRRLPDGARRAVLVHRHRRILGGNGKFDRGRDRQPDALDLQLRGVARRTHVRNGPGRLLEARRGLGLDSSTTPPGTGNDGTLSSTGTARSASLPSPLVFDNQNSVSFSGGYGLLGTNNLPASNVAQTIAFWANITSTATTQTMVVAERHQQRGERRYHRGPRAHGYVKRRHRPGQRHRADHGRLAPHRLRL